MTELTVSPTILATLARNQTDAAAYAQAGADALSGTGKDCWVSHGVISGASNVAFDTIEGIRQATGTAFADASLGLAAKLQAADAAYGGVDEELADNLQSQMRDR
ncbi:type VII secretion target [Mycobacterium sp. ML4]